MKSLEKTMIKCLLKKQLSQLYDGVPWTTSRREFGMFANAMTTSIQEESWHRMNEKTRQLAQALTHGEHDERAADEISVRSYRFQRRFALSRAITLVESRAAAHREQADLLLTYLLSLNNKKASQSHNDRSSFRVGLAGPPGAGKSTFIESFGKRILDISEPSTESSLGHDSSMSSPSFIPEKLAVVCIDPSSSVTGGSILGDKTRMMELSRHERAFIRPSANGGTFGGLSAYTHDVVSLCQAADYQLVMVETVGLGQSEVEVAESVDMLVLVVPPGGGDELQGVKKGIIEVADMLLVTKADGNLLPAARSTAADYRGAMKFQRHRHEQWGPPPVLLTSAVTGDGLDKVWSEICRFRTIMIETNELDRKRKRQNKYWMWKNLQNLITAKTKEDPILHKAAQEMEQALLQGTITPRVAAAELLDMFLKNTATS